MKSMLQLVGAEGGWTFYSDRAALPAARTFVTQDQAFLDIQPVHQLMVHQPPFPAQQHAQPTIPVPDPAPGQVSKSNPQGRPLVSSALVAKRCPSHLQYGTR